MAGLKLGALFIRNCLDLVHKSMRNKKKIEKIKRKMTQKKVRKTSATKAPKKKTKKRK